MRLRFLTVHDTEGTFGSDPLTIDLQANPDLPGNVREALATCTLVGHNLDFDLTVLRRYGIPVSSAPSSTRCWPPVCLGLGKEKFKVRSDIAYCDLDREDLEELVSLEDPNPVDHDLATVVKGISGSGWRKPARSLADPIGAAPISLPPITSTWLKTSVICRRSGPYSNRHCGRLNSTRRSVSG